MVSFKGFDDLLFDSDGFICSKVKPFNEKYWSDKWELRKAEFDKQMEFKDYKMAHELFVESAVDTVLNKMLSFVDDAPIMRILVSNRYRYFNYRIYITCFVLLKHISKSIRSNELSSIQETLLKIRWYLFEVNSYINAFVDAFETVISPDRYELATEAEERNAINYLTSIYFRDCLMTLYKHISIVNGDNATDDIYFASLAANRKKTRSTYTIFQSHIKARILEGDVARLSDLYSKLKKLLWDIENTDLSEPWYDSQLLNDVMQIEDTLFCKQILHNIISSSEAELIIGKQGDLFNLIYIDITNQIKQEALPNNRMFLIEDTINAIKVFLNDQQSNKIDFLDSIPRKLIRRLTIDYDTIKANPTIDLKEFDRNGIKPIQTNISVSHLALLFKVLEEHSVIKSDQRNELYKTITKAFASKSVTGTTISEKSFQNNFNDPDKGSYKYWKEKFITFSKDFKNYN